MKPKLVVVDNIKTGLIRESRGFAKKALSSWKLDIIGLCQFGCRYCSSNNGNYLRINRKCFGAATRTQLGEHVLPADDPALMFLYDDVVSQLAGELARKRKFFGAGDTLVFSMLTDGFSPYLVQQGITEAVLRLLMERTSFRVRVLSQNAIVGSDKWISFFREFPGRFVVGLSTGTTDDPWAKKIEIGTSNPTARLRALASLQAAGIPTYGMLCPIFPDMLENGKLEELINKTNPAMCEDVWAEPYNDRDNWRVVRDGYERSSFGYRWMTTAYESSEKGLWSSYATDLYLRLRDRARVDGWLEKLRYLLYESSPGQPITANDAIRMGKMEGMMLQSPPDNETGFSSNLAVAAMQRGEKPKGNVGPSKVTKSPFVSLIEDDGPEVLETKPKAGSTPQDENAHVIEWAKVQINAQAAWLASIGAA